ncbi:recombinase family protein [Clostridium sp.]|uniref:recombinase family protein n=1 Tax=Clostridium sp. TaxID=1506 RepID=UPI003D6D763A
MPRITIKSLQEEIETLKTHSSLLAYDLESQKKETAKCKKLYDNFKIKHRRERNVLVKRLEELEEELNSSQIKLNARNAGRKAYSNKNVIGIIYNLYLDGKSLQGIANELNGAKIKTNRGREWSKSSIRFILLNFKNVSNGFVEEDIFNRAVKLLSDNKK